MRVIVKKCRWCDDKNMPGRRIAILGFGREGRSVLKFLKRSPDYRGAEIKILDKKINKNYLKNLERFDLIFRSPGIPYNLPELQKARRAGVKLSSATKLFFEHFPRKNIVGITGTKGKGTAATILYKILKAARKRVFLAGNIGRPALGAPGGTNKKSIAILELSSFQLQDLETSPHIAAVLDVFPDHQDAHLNLREYYEAKTSIARHQKPGDKIFFFQNHHLSKWVASKGGGKKITVDPSTTLRTGETKSKLFGPADLTMPGYHNFKNAVMAAAVAKTLGVPDRTIVKTVKNFRGLEHRLEFVRKIMARQARHKNKSAIYFYNDSASTNPQTTIAAVKAFPGARKILIAGGYDKGLDYKPLARALKNSGTELVILMGENKKKIAKAIKRQETGDKRQEYAIVFVKNLGEAVKKAYKYALSLVACHLSPVAIVFSPGAASFDMFKNYADRGRQFKKIVKSLK